MLLLFAAGNVHAKCWSDFLCCQGSKRMKCAAGKATAAHDTCGGGQVCLGTNTGVPECQPASVSSYFKYHDQVSYCQGSCRVDCIGGYCQGDCTAGTVCNAGTCEQSTCGTPYEWHNAYDSYYPNGKVPATSGLRSVCMSDVGWGFGVRSDGSLFYWGKGKHYESQGPAWDGLFTNGNVTAIKDAVQVACLRYSVMVLRKNGTVAHWGTMTRNEKHVTYPTGMPAYSGIVAIAAGNYAGAVLDSSGKISIFGFEKNNIYADLQGKTGFKAIGGGGGGFVGVKADGTIAAASGDKFGNKHAAPPAISNVIQATLGAGGTGIALQSDGKVVVWGSGAAKPPADLLKVTAVAADTDNVGQRFLALQVDGTVRVWGGYNTKIAKETDALTGINFLDPHGRAALGCPNTTCGAISDLGCCSGGKVYRCSGGKLTSETCSSGKCGWNTTGGAHTCGTAGTGVSGGYHLQACVCVPNCAGKQCGSDGCGGTCDTGTCDDGDPCTADDKCKGENCTAGPFNPACDDNNPCTSDSCSNDGGKAACKHTDKAGACDDGDPCSTGDACEAGKCKAGSKPLDCDDANPCTDDSCQVGKGCQHAHNTAKCNDGDACTAVDLCKDGKCGAQPSGSCAGSTSTVELTCDGTITEITWAKYGLANGACPSWNFYGCQTDAVSWVKGLCVGKASCKLVNPHLSIGDPCPGKSKVLAVKFKCDNKSPKNATDCDDANPCTDDSCDAKSGCQHANTTKPCDDGSTCTESSACQDGKCVGKGLDCDDGNPCTVDNCSSPTKCAPKTDVADGSKCHDGNKCHVTGTCSSGTCTGLNAVTCDDGNLCTNDSCDPKTGCVFAANTSSCSDGDACTEGDACADKSCKAGPALQCDDGDPCTTNACDAGKGCQYPNNTASCDDGNTCTLKDTCTDGKCVGDAKTCEDGNVCTTDNCNPQLGCQHGLRNVACEDGDVCTQGDSCQGGSCKAGVAPPCNDGNACTADSCDAKSGCTYTPNSAPCNDKNPCTLGDACGGGSCQAGKGVRNCDDQNPCTNDTCNSTVGCVHTPNTAACNDGDICTLGDTCVGGSCKGGSKPCDDGNPCTQDACNALVGCVHTNLKGGACDDGKKCTLGDSCSGGTCTGVAKGCDDGNPCTQDYCFEHIAGGCYHNTFPADGKACDDGDKCTVEGSCAAGKCVGKTKCLSGGCSVAANGAPYCGCGDGEVQRPSGNFLYCCKRQCTADSVCGDDGCGGTCGAGCKGDEYCTDDKTACLPKVACYGKAPVDVGCCDGRTVRSCAAPASLTTEDCSKAGAFCGWDAAKQRYGCTPDGKPAPNASQHPFACPKADACVPDCKGRVCGPDGCGGTCGACTKEGEVCAPSTGTCAVPCGGAYPLHGCVAEQSGIDVVTYCPSADSKPGDATQVACAQGVKAGWSAKEQRYVCGGTDKAPADKGKACQESCFCGVGATAFDCGKLSCGVDCGTCGSGSSCVDNRCCEPDCDGKTCGADGCGGTCGTCKGDKEQCMPWGQCAVVDCGDVDHNGTCTGDVAKFCGPSGVVTHDCAALGATCGTLPGTALKGCLVAKPALCATKACTSGGAGQCSCAPGCVESGTCCANYDWTCGPKGAGSCGDGTCAASAGETCDTCAKDCGTCKAQAAAKHVLPYPHVLQHTGRPAQHAALGPAPLDDVRPSPPPLPVDGLLAHVAQRGAVEGSPRTRVVEDDLAQDLNKIHKVTSFSGQLSDVPKGRAGMGFSSRKGSDTTGGGLRVTSGHRMARAARYDRHGRGGFTVAGWVRTPKAARKLPMPLASSVSLIPTSSGLYGFSLDSEVCAVARPGDTSVHLSCGHPKKHIAQIQVYWGNTPTKPWPAPAGSDVCGWVDALPRSYGCGGDISEHFASAVGKTSVTVNALSEVGDACAGPATQGTQSTLIARAVCRLVERPAQFTLLVESDAQGGRLALQRGEHSVLLRSKSPLPADKWVHVALVFEPLHASDPNALTVGRLGLYVDGALVAHVDTAVSLKTYQWTWGGGRLPGDSSLVYKSTWPHYLYKDFLEWPLSSYVGAKVVTMGAIADFDELVHYDRALSAAELRTVRGAPDVGLVRVWPARPGAEVARDNLWTRGGGVAAVPVDNPELFQPTATGGTETLRAPHMGVLPAAGATLALPAEGADLSGLSRWSLVTWLAPKKGGPGTTLLALKDGDQARLALKRHSGCGGRALEVVFPDGKSVVQTDCSHLLTQDRWSFVAVVQDSKERRVLVDGLTSTAAGQGALFAEGTKGPRVVELTDAAALGWSALYRRPMTGDEVASQRGAGPVVWLDGAVLGSYDGRSGVPRDLAAFHNQAAGGASDHVTAHKAGSQVSAAAANLAAGSAGYVQVPARGRLQPEPGGDLRNLSVVETVLVDAAVAGSDVARPLLQWVVGGRSAGQAWLRCKGADKFAGSGHSKAVSCRLHTQRHAASGGSTVHVSAPWLVSAKAWPVSLRVAVALSAAPEAAVAALAAKGSDAAVTLGATVASAGQSVTLPLSTGSTKPPALAVSGADALYVPGRLDGTGGTAASVGFNGVSDIRVYPRALSGPELKVVTRPGCQAMGCSDDRRVCNSAVIAAGAAGLAGTTVAACGGCKADSYGQFGQCLPRVEMDRACTLDAGCLTNRCSTTTDGLGKGLCVMPLNEAKACESKCLGYGRKCLLNEKTGNAQCGACAKYFGKAWWGNDSDWGEVQDGVRRCAWNPQIAANRPCDLNQGCKSGLCIERIVPVYDVTTKAKTTAGRYKKAVYKKKGNDPNNWTPAGPTLQCPGKGCVGKKKASKKVQVCAAQSPLTCGGLRRKQSMVKGTKWDGTATSGYRCEGCQSVMYAGKNLYRESFSLIEPKGCATLYDHWLDLQSTDARGRAGVHVNNQFYVSSWPRGQTPKDAYAYESGLKPVGEPSPQARGDILDAEPSEAIIRRLVLKDTDTTKRLQPKQMSLISAAGIGVDLMAWSTQVTGAARLAYMRKTDGRGPDYVNHNFASHFPIGACLAADTKWANSGYKTKWGPDKSGTWVPISNTWTTWQDTYHSPYFDETLNRPVCTVNKYPDGTVCPPPGLEKKFTRSNAGLMCISGFCAADTGRCEEGYTWYEKVEGQGRNDGNGGGSSNDLGPFALNQDHGSTLRFEEVDKKVPLQKNTTDRRHFFLEAHSKSGASLFGKTQDLLDVGLELVTNPGAAKGKDRATFKSEFLVFGLAPPSVPVPSLPSLSCSGPQFKNGELQEGVTCKPQRKQIALAVKGPGGESSLGGVGQVNATTDTGASSVAQALADAGQDSSRNMIDPGSVSVATFLVPLPLGDCPNKDGFKYVDGKACFQKKTLAGPVPLKVTAELAPEISISFGLELDSDTYEPAFVITPAIGLPILLKGGLDLGAVYAGIYGNITIMEIGLPVAFGLGFRKGVKQVSGKTTTIADLWKFDRVIRTDLRLTFLKLGLGLFFEIGFDPLSFEVTHELFGFPGISVTWTLGKAIVHSLKLDFAFDPVGDSHPTGAL